MLNNGTQLVQLSKATQMLAEAKSLDEVKKILDIAEAARVYARAAKLGLEAYNHAAEVKVRAERKAGEMLAQIDPERGGDRRSENFKETVSVPLKTKRQEVLEEYEIADTTAKRWQQLAKLPEPEFEKRIEETRGESPITTSGLVGEIRKAPHVAHNSGENEWYTPNDIVSAARDVLEVIDLDPASSKTANGSVRASTYYSVNDNGLTKEWSGRVWMNPPYASDLISKFTSKLTQHYLRDDVQEALVLVNNATDTTWFQDMAKHSKGICLLRGRVRFWGPSGQIGAPLQGQVVLYFGGNSERFDQAFSRFGLVVWT